MRGRRRSSPNQVGADPEALLADRRNPIRVGASEMRGTKPFRSPPATSVGHSRRRLCPRTKVRPPCPGPLSHGGLDHGCAYSDEDSADQHCLSRGSRVARRALSPLEIQQGGPPASPPVRRKAHSRAAPTEHRRADTAHVGPTALPDVLSALVLKSRDHRRGGNLHRTADHRRGRTQPSTHIGSHSVLVVGELVEIARRKRKVVSPDLVTPPEAVKITERCDAYPHLSQRGAVVHRKLAQQRLGLPCQQVRSDHYIAVSVTRPDRQELQRVLRRRNDDEERKPSNLLLARVRS